MVEFKRELSSQFLSALAKLAEAPEANWWKDILGVDRFSIAVRRDYLSVYTNGQSLFEIRLQPGSDKLVLKTHYKYLLKPTIARNREYMKFIDGSFLGESGKLSGDLLVNLQYSPTLLSEMAAAAKSYAIEEKKGIDKIIFSNSNIIDTEIAFRGAPVEVDDPLPVLEHVPSIQSKASAQRIDFAALFPHGKQTARLVFFEAKTYSNNELRTSKVVNQLKNYQTFLSNNVGSIRKAYTNVCSLFLRLNPDKEHNSLVIDVAKGDRSLEVETDPNLVIFGFDQDQKRGRLQEIIKNLEDRGISPKRILSKGDPTSFVLKDRAATSPSPRRRART